MNTSDRTELLRELVFDTDIDRPPIRKFYIYAKLGGNPDLAAEFAKLDNEFDPLFGKLLNLRDELDNCIWADDFDPKDI